MRKIQFVITCKVLESLMRKEGTKKSHPSSAGNDFCNVNLFPNVLSLSFVRLP